MARRKRQVTEMDAAEYRDASDEAAWQATVIAAAQALGWKVIHVKNMIANDPGIPDLLLFRDERYLLVELKTETGAVSHKQRQWHWEMAQCGGRVHVWRPSDWHEVEAALQ